MKLEKIKIYFNSLRTLFVYFMVKDNDLLRADVNRWNNVKQKVFKNFFEALNYYITKYKEFRNIVIYRERKHIIRYCILRMILPRVKYLFINAKSIEGGLVVCHGHSTEINAERIGENFTVYQNVTIGIRNGGVPVIGDNVTITTSAVVLGSIKIGDNSAIGANATITKNVPPNCTVIGGQGFIIKENGVRVNKPL